MQTPIAHFNRDHLSCSLADCKRDVPCSTLAWMGNYDVFALLLQDIAFKFPIISCY